jgi:phage-related protein
MSYDLGTAHGKITLEYDGEREAEQADDDIDKIGRSAKKSDDDVKKFAKSLSKAFSVIGKAGVLTVLVAGLTNGAIQAAALGVQLLGIIPSLVSIASLAGSLPALFLAGFAAVGVLKAALAGVGDALTEAIEGDLTKFNEALEKLSPQAKEFAIAFKDAVPALKAVQQGIQDAFFSNNLEDLLPRVTGLLQTLAPQLNQVAAQFGGMAKEILDVGTNAYGVRIVQDAVGLLQQSLINLAPAIRPIVQGLQDVARVGTDFLEPFSTGIGDLATRFGLWLSQIANGGQLFSWMTQATSTLGTLRDLVVGLGGALAGIFRIAEQTGGGLLNTLAELAQAANEFVNSADGSAAIAAAFTGILEVARQLAPIFTIIAKAILSSLGPALADLAIGLGPILQDAVTRLVPALTPLANAIVQLILAIAPLLPAVAQIAAVLGTQLATAISAVASVLGPFIEDFGGTLAQAFGAAPGSHGACPDRAAGNGRRRPSTGGGLRATGAGHPGVRAHVGG